MSLQPFSVDGAPAVSEVFMRLVITPVTSIDVAITTFNVENQLDTRGFISGDILDLDVTVLIMDTYSDGGQIEICYNNQCFVRLL